MGSREFNQLQTFAALWAEIRPRVREDKQLAAYIQKRLAKEKRFGSRDRRLYRELIYTALRYLPWWDELIAPNATRDPALAVLWLAAAIPAVRPLKQSLLDGWPEPAASVAAKSAYLGVSRSLLPEWVHDECPAATRSPLLDVLHQRAPLWCRLSAQHVEQTSAELEREGWRKSEQLPQAWRTDQEVDVTQSAAYREGRLEIQDLGSQLVLASVAPVAGERWLDACAGAGGKTLQLADSVGPSGEVIACDIRSAALEELQSRAHRAGLKNVCVNTHPRGEFDGVLVDAPCTGSGTWRRSPQLKWSTTQQEIEAKADLQAKLLRQFAVHVKSGGRLVYATCSLCRTENDTVVESFLRSDPEFSPSDFASTWGIARQQFGLPIPPDRFDSDSYFVSVLRRR